MTSDYCAYDREFYDFQSNRSFESAKTITPYIMDLIKVNSVIDVGCGVGAWLRAFSEAGARGPIKGMDGEYVNSDQLLIDRTEFVAFDLRKSISMPERFDLAVSLEVAEHLPTKRGPSFIADLIALSDYVLFSAAIPGQGGTEHINEQWQSYWAELFAQHDYVACDVIRPKFWNNRSVDWWYRQNIIIYVNQRALTDTLMGNSHSIILDVVHPELWNARPARLDELGVSRIVSSLPSLIAKAIKKKVDD